MRSLKQQLRNQIRHRRRLISVQEQSHAATEIAHRLFKSNSFKQAQKIALYLPFEGEVSTFLILAQALRAHKSCFAPILVNHLLHFAKIENHTPLAPNRFGIFEPHSRHNIVISAHSLDLVLLPLVAFDRECHRLGMGGGYYDKTFAFRKRGHKPRLVGLAYDFQRVSLIPRTGSDLSLDEVITERHHYQKR